MNIIMKHTFPLSKSIFKYMFSSIWIFMKSYIQNINFFNKQICHITHIPMDIALVRNNVTLVHERIGFCWWWIFGPGEGRYSIENMITVIHSFNKCVTILALYYSKSNSIFVCIGGPWPFAVVLFTIRRTERRRKQLK
jgi:hypothetical protein